MRFGEYIKARRKSLQMRQEDIAGISQTYISDIELGNRIPTSIDIIEKLARALQLPQDKTIWLQVYALLDHNPEEYFGKLPITNIMINESGNHYAASTPELTVGATPGEVVHLLGEPSKRIRFGNQMRWTYPDLNWCLIFKNDRVESVENI